MNMPMPVAVGIWVVIGILLLMIVLTGRRRLAARTPSTVPPPPPVPADLGEPLTPTVAATYVSTTLAGDWLARIGTHAWGDRSAADVTVYESGILLARRGAPDVFIPAVSIENAALAPGMAGKYVGKEGLVVVTWSLLAAGTTGPDRSDHRLDTGLRTQRAADRTVLLDALRAISTPTGSTASTAPSPALSNDEEPNDDSKEPQ